MGGASPDGGKCHCDYPDQRPRLLDQLFNGNMAYCSRRLCLGRCGLHIRKRLRFDPYMGYWIVYPGRRLQHAFPRCEQLLYAEPYCPDQIRHRSSASQIPMAGFWIPELSQPLAHQQKEDSMGYSRLDLSSASLRTAMRSAVEDG